MLSPAKASRQNSNGLTLAHKSKCDSFLRFLEPRMVKNSYGKKSMVDYLAVTMLQNKTNEKKRAQTLQHS